MCISLRSVGRQVQLLFPVPAIRSPAGGNKRAAGTLPDKGGWWLSANPANRNAEESLEGDLISELWYETACDRAKHTHSLTHTHLHIPHSLLSPQRQPASKGPDSFVIHGSLSLIIYSFVLCIRAPVETNVSAAMSSPNKSNSPSAAADAEQPEEKPRLTEAEKKQNHIASGTSGTPL